jgi:phosphoglycolate phosphatase
MSYGLVIFDGDGTLVDSFPWFARVLNEVADRFGFRRTDAAEREALRLCGTREILRRLDVPLWRLPAIAAHMRRLKAEVGAAETPPFPGVPEMLQALSRRGVALAVVSSDAEDTIRRLLGPATAGRIGHWACGAALLGKGPKLRAVLRRAGVPAGRALYVGDEVRDAEAAREAGLAFGAVTWGYARPEALLAARPAHVFASAAEIAGLLGPGCASAAAG